MTDLRKTAENQMCMVRIPGVCNFNPETTVLAHLNGGGMGGKHPDLLGAFCCSDCHDVIDGRRYVTYTPEQVKLMHLEGIMRTQQWWIDNDIVKW